MSAETSLKIDGCEWRIPEWFPNLGEDKLRKLQTYHYELINFNKKMNLISPNTEREADKIHFADCIIASQHIINESQAPVIYDLGSGNGFPGLVMAILDPSRKMILIDADLRKVEFLKHVVMRLELKNVEVKAMRVEDIAENSIECAVSRAFANIPKVILWVRKACKLGCELYHMKSDSWVTEMANIPAQLITNWAPQHVADYELPVENIKLSIILTKKIS